MDSSYFTNPLVFLVQVMFELYLLIVMLRFLLQLVRADFYNPVSQFIVKATGPVLTPLRRLVPAFGGMDTSSLLLAWVIKSVELFLIILISGKGTMLLYPIMLAIPGLLELTINIFLFSILILVILSWVSPGSYNPAIGLLNSLTEPVMRPARRIIPPMGGLDLSPMAVLIGLSLLQMLIIPPLEHVARMIAF
jgi:YggT family protein